MTALVALTAAVGGFFAEAAGVCDDDPMGGLFTSCASFDDILSGESLPSAASGRVSRISRTEARPVVYSLPSPTRETIMLVAVAAVLVAIAQAQTAQTATKRAAAARRKAAVLLEAKSQVDDAAEKVLIELDRVRLQTADELATSRTSAEQAQIAARAKLEEVRAAAAKAVADVQEAAAAAIQQAIADCDRILAERTTALRRQTEQAMADAQAQVKSLQDEADGAKVEAEQLIKTLRDELADATNAATRAELDRSTVAQPTQAGLATARSHGLPRRRTPKMTPALVDKAQRMYDSGRHNVAEIARSCGVSTTTIYRHIRTGQTTAH